MYLFKCCVCEFGYILGVLGMSMYSLYGFSEHGMSRGTFLKSQIIMSCEKTFK